MQGSDGCSRPVKLVPRSVAIEHDSERWGTGGRGDAMANDGFQQRGGRNLSGTKASIQSWRSMESDGSISSPCDMLAPMLLFGFGNVSGGN